MLLKNIKLKGINLLLLVGNSMGQDQVEIGLLKDHIFKELKQSLLKVLKEFIEVI
jgi:hypothetical protein